MGNFSNTITPVTGKKTIYKGNTKTYNFILKRGSIPINLTGYSILFSACADIDNPISTSLFSSSCSITTAIEGTCQATLSSADTDTLCTNGIADVTLVDSSGHRDTLGQFYIDIMPV